MRPAQRQAAGFFARNSDVVLALGVVGTLVALIVPLPTTVLDLLLTFNFSYVLLMLMVVLSVKTPLELSTFPSLLLIGTLFRLSVNVASTRLILLHAYAGHIIQSFGEFVVGGNMVVGIIMFLIIIVIQFKVINAGSGRIAEVAARFTLDGMPGKQMAIDADLNAGLITEEEARQRRQKIVDEAEFYGAMDGAAKYVKGDAIAGLLIMAINIIGGIVIGLTRGMTVVDALRTYCLLTVGDGLVTQIPSIIMATAAGILTTKTQSEHGLSDDMGQQVFANRRAMGTAALVVLGFGLVPGLPIVPFSVLALGLGACYAVMRPSGAAVLAEPAMGVEELRRQREEEENYIRAMLEPDRIAVEVGYNLIQLIDPQRGGSLLERIKALRKQFARDLGMIIPKVRILDNVALDTNDYCIKLMGHRIAKGTIHPGWIMVMNPGDKPKGIGGIEGEDPSFGLPVVWTGPGEKDRSQAKGYTVVDAESVFITHLSEVLRRHAHELLSRQDVQVMLDNIKADNPAVVEDLIPDVLTASQLQTVLENLLSEGVPINNLTYILEKLGSYARLMKDPMLLTELVRKSLARAISAKFSDGEDRINALSLDPRVEEELRGSIERTDGEVKINLSPQRLRQIIAAISDQARSAFQVGSETVILTDAQIRPYVRSIICRVFPDIPVISYDEIAESVHVNNVGVIAAGTSELVEPV
jgi:flagellar biosynthesis protein FlhA